MNGFICAAPRDLIFQTGLLTQPEAGLQRLSSPIDDESDSYQECDHYEFSRTVSTIWGDAEEHLDEIHGSLLSGTHKAGVNAG
jgi:hypothetical protein